jgi:hypothetical protein
VATVGGVVGAVQVRRVTYARRANGFTLEGRARLTLPAAFGQAVIERDSLEITASGLASGFTAGRLGETYDPSTTPLTSVALGTGTGLDVLGVRWTPGTSTGVTIAAALTTPLFAGGSTRHGVYFTVQADGTGLRTTLDQSALEARQFPSGRFAFQPASFGGVPAAQLALTLDALTLTLRGTLRLPQVADGFAVSVQDIRLGTAGLQLPSGNADAGPVPQDVRIFGGTMVVRRTGTTPVLQLGWNSGVLTVTLSGDLPVLGRTTAVTGLAIGSDGSLVLGSGSGFVLIPALGASSPPAGGSPGAAADPVAAITDLGAANGRLALGGRVVLPAPFRQQQGDGGQFQLELGLDGAPTATSVTVWNQTEGCCDRAGRAMLPLGPMALVHARRLDLTLDVQDVARSSVSLVADAYLGATDAARAANRVAFGSVNGSIVRPGLRVGFDGSVTLGNVALLREFTVGFQSLNLTVKSIAIPNTVTLSSAGAEGDGSPFAFVVSGGLSLNVAQVSGSIAFQDVSIGTRGVGFTPTSLQAATLRVAGVLSLELSDLAIITRDTTVSIAPSDQGGTARSLQVRNLVSFGGRLTLEGSGLSGGVERFLFYQTTAGETALLIKGATLSIPNTVEFRADFEFSQRPDGFLMALGATGTLLEKVSVGMYGMVSNSTTDGLRFGMFLRSTVEIPILPGVLTVAELGGGFFYRPRDVDISNAWQAAGLDPSLRSIGGNVPQNPSAGQGLLFAVMLYGRLNLVSGVASGRTLITITDRYFEILGEVTLLQRQNELVGTIRLQLGITEAYAEGDIRIRVQLAGIITGNAQLAFFVYGPNTWGVIGSMNVRVLNFLNASGKLFIGPPGFLIRLDVRAGFNVSVVKVNTTFRAAVWYVRVGNEVGGFGELSVRAEVFDGLATITATLRGAFLFRSGYSLLYASASVKVETFLGDFSGSIWVKVENGDVDGGLGRDKTMDRLVARAAQVEEMMTQAAQSATAAITEARNVANTISVSTQELSSAFDRFQQQDEYYRTWLVNSAIDLEARTDPTGLPQDWVTARQQYARALAGQLSYEERVWLFTPRMPSVDSLATALDATRQQVIDRLRRTTARIVEVTESPLPDDPEDPLTGDVPDSLVSETITANGTTTKRVASMPTFAVDPAKAAAAVQRTNAWLGLGRVSAAQLRVAIDSLERTLTDVRVLVDDRTDDSFLRYAERYSRARQAMEQYVVASIATARLRLRHADSAVAVMRRITPSLETHVARKTQVIASSGNWTQMRELLAYRATILERVGVPINTRELVTRYLNLDPGLYPSLRSNVDTLGLALWVRLGEQNMPRWRDTLRTRLTGLERGAAVGELEALRRGHAELSAAAAELFDAQGNLYVALRDAYDAYARSFFVDPVREAWQSLPMPTEEFLGILRRRREVRDLVDRPPRPPRITTLANEQMLWSQVRVDIDPQWPLVDAYFVAEEPADGPPNPSYLIGRAQSAWFHVPIPDPAGRMRTSPRAVRVTMRAGAGYALERRMGYDARFLVDAGSFATGVFTTSTTNDPTPPSVPRFQATGGREFTAPWGPFAGQRLLYVPSLDRITMAWSVTSNAGVSAWEIGVGTRADSADILPVRGLAGRTSFTFTGLDAYGGRPLYWRGRARSGDGVLGPFGASAGVVRDTVAPRLTTQRTPTVSAPRTVPIAALPPTNLRLQACRTGRPADQARWFEPVPAPERTIEVSQPTADRAAGVPAVWAWRVDTTATPGARDTGWTEVTGPSVRISSTRLDYTRPWFVHTRAINPSGVLSNVLVSSPIRLENDRSPATPPEFCQLTTADGGLRLVPSAASRDAESGVRGYQFSVVRGATVLRAFPTGTAIDLAAADWTPETAVTLGTNGTAWRLPPADLDSSAVVVLVRAVNGGGVLSATSAGHVATTKLAPPNPVIDSVRTTISISPVGFLLTARLRHDGRAGETATPFFEYSLTRDAVGDPQWRPASEALRVTWPFLSGNRAVLRVRIRAGNGLTSPIVSQELRW